MRKWSGFLVVLPMRLAGCSSLTPKQSAGLKEAQHFADKVTATYRVDRVRVIPGDGASYWERSDWIILDPEILVRDDRLVFVATLLPWATLRLPPQGRWPSAQEEQPRRFAANRRGVEILVEFLGMTEREALQRYATAFVEQSKVYAANRAQVGGAAARVFYSRWKFYLIHPCDQLHDLWTHFAVAEPEPACQK